MKYDNMDIWDLLSILFCILCFLFVKSAPIIGRIATKRYEFDDWTQKTDKYIRDKRFFWIKSDKVFKIVIHFLSVGIPSGIFILWFLRFNYS